MRRVLSMIGVCALTVAAMSIAKASGDFEPPPVPEPASLMALGAGIGSIVLSKVLRKK